jgi:hypothetical protein
MKNFKLSLLLLTAVFALQSFSANAMFSKFAAFAKRKSAAVTSFFSNTAKSNWGFSNPFARRFALGTTVASLATSKAAEKINEPQSKTLTYDEAKKRYMVAIREKIGVGKKESCYGFFVENYPKSDGFWLSMRCPKTTTWGNVSDNASLHALVKKSEIETVKNILAKSTLSTPAFNKGLEKQIDEADHVLANLSNIKISEPGTQFSPHVNKGFFTFKKDWFYGNSYELGHFFETSEYDAIAKSLLEQEATLTKEQNIAQAFNKNLQNSK